MLTAMDDSFNLGGNLFTEIFELGNQAPYMISTWGDIFMSGDVKQYTKSKSDKSRER